MSDDAKDLTKLKRPALDKLAAEAGVPDPGKLPNKDAVAEAIEAPNPALAPEPDPEPGEVEYEVIGPHPVHGTATGGKFTALIAPSQLALLMESGHIKPTTEKD